MCLYIHTDTSLTVEPSGEIPRHIKRAVLTKHVALQLPEGQVLLLGHLLAQSISKLCHRDLQVALAGALIDK